MWRTRSEERFHESRLGQVRAPKKCDSHEEVHDDSAGAANGGGQAVRQPNHPATQVTTLKAEGMSQGFSVSDVNDPAIDGARPPTQVPTNVPAKGEISNRKRPPAVQTVIRAHEPDQVPSNQPYQKASDSAQPEWSTGSHTHAHDEG